MIEARFRGRLGAFYLDAELNIEASEITAIMGPSGCGKTSFLRCIAGLTRLPGRLSVQGAIWQDDIRFLPAHLRPVGYVFQEASLFAHLSVRRNLRFGLERARGPIRIGEDEVIALLGLEPLLQRAPSKLSGGERQRVAIGRALLRRPQLLLMDEPLSSLDAETKAELMPLIARLPEVLKAPVIYVTHDPYEAARVAVRTVRMSGGRMVETEARTAEHASDAYLDSLPQHTLSALALAALRAGLAPDRG